MRVNSVQTYAFSQSRVKSASNGSVVRAPQSSSNVVQLIFTGGAKNLKQLASITPENNGLGLPEASQGGEGVVGYEMPASFRKHEGIDARSFMPFWEYDNPKGGYKFVIHREADYPKGAAELPDTMPAKAFYSAEPGETLEVVAKKLNRHYIGIEAEKQYCV